MNLCLKKSCVGVDLQSGTAVETRSSSFPSG
jgi:hypothetical protein